MSQRRIKMSLEKSNNVFEQNCKYGQARIKETHVYNNCLEIRSGAVNNRIEVILG